VIAIEMESVSTELASALLDGLVLSAPPKSAPTVAPITVTVTMALARATKVTLALIVQREHVLTRVRTTVFATTANVFATKDILVTTALYEVA